jgi:ribose 5-phosphate isomerase B
VIVAVAADHAGRPLLDRVNEAVKAAGHEPMVVGATDVDPADDYPDVAAAVARAVLAGQAVRGIVVCGSGAGVAVAANKFRGIRAAMAHDTYTAHQMVEHDDVNVLALGARVVGPELAADVVSAYVAASFSGEERHVRRLGKIADLERENSGG